MYVCEHGGGGVTSLIPRHTALIYYWQKRTVSKPAVHTHIPTCVSSGLMTTVIHIFGFFWSLTCATATGKAHLPVKLLDHLPIVSQWGVGLYVYLSFWCWTCVWLDSSWVFPVLELLWVHACNFPVVSQKRSCLWSRITCCGVVMDSVVVGTLLQWRLLSHRGVCVTQMCQMGLRCSTVTCFLGLSLSSVAWNVSFSDKD